MALIGNEFCDSRVTVKKAELLATIMSNRTKHVQEHGEAMEGYTRRTLEEARKIVAAGEAGKEMDRTPISSLVVPPNHAKDYDRVIRMLEMSTADEVVVSEGQFSNFVLDEWSWSQSFKTSTARYTGK